MYIWLISYSLWIFSVKNAFSDISFYWPKDQESSLGNMNFQNLIFVKRSNAQCRRNQYVWSYLSSKFRRCFHQKTFPSLVKYKIIPSFFARDVVKTHCCNVFWQIATMCFDKCKQNKIATKKYRSCLCSDSSACHEEDIWNFMKKSKSFNGYVTLPDGEDLSSLILSSSSTSISRSSSS